MIDTHAHVIATDERRYPRAPLGGKQSDWSRERPVSAEQMLAAMDAAGIDKTVLVQASTCYGHDNSYLADAVAAHPRRFIGVFSVDVLAPDAPQSFLERVVKTFGAPRIAWGSNFPAAEGKLAALLAEARQALADLSDVERGWIFSRAAKNLYAGLA